MTDHVHKPRIDWIPAHPSCGVESMRRYWSALTTAVDADDPFTIQCVVTPEDRGLRRDLKFRVRRQIARSITYPAQISWNVKGRIVHVLDHSWADMIPWIHRSAARIVTVHDLIPMVSPGDLSPHQVARFRKRVAHIDKAEFVVAVSEYTKRQVVELLEVEEERVVVVPNGVAAPILSQSSSRILRSFQRWNQEHFIIGSIGAVLPRKNLEALPVAINAMRERSGRIPVIIRAGSPLTPALRHLFETSVRPGHFMELGRLTDAEVSQFYSSLNVLVVPSWLEGFGLPVLEGMIHGVPVICGNQSSLPEVGADDVFSFNPSDPEEFGERILEVEQGHYSQDRIESARRRAGRFSWRSTLEGIYRVYKKFC